jgi:uncharacterized phiE125 gp8 family phage protein
VRSSRFSIRTVTPAAAIPLPFPVDDDLKRTLLKVDPTGDTGFDAAQDALIEAQLRAAMDHVERFTSQVLTARTMELVMGGFPCLPELISIPREPVTAITSIAYTDPDSGNEVAMDSAAWRWADTAPDVILPAFRQAWPVSAAERGSVRVTFEAGYEDGLAPPALLAAARMMLVHLFENRNPVEAGERAAAVELPLGVRDLCAAYRRILL